MKILLTGATGYIGKRLLPHLIKAGHHVVCLVRDKQRFSPPAHLLPHVSIIEADLLEPMSLEVIPSEIDAAYYLVHSMSHSEDYLDLERNSAINFTQRISQTNAQQVLYLGGIVNQNELSPHLLSRKNVAAELSKGSYHFTSLNAGIIVGSGSASFEIMRDLVEKLPLMITPKWLMTQCQPIGISDVIQILDRSLLNPQTYDQQFDIGCEDTLSYKEMLLIFAEARGLKRSIITVPVMTPRLSSYWLYFVTSTSFKLAKNLVDSMKVKVVCADNRINKILNITTISYRASLDRAFQKTENNEVESSWKDSFSSSGIQYNHSKYIEVPQFGCFRDRRSRSVPQIDSCVAKIWSIGGENGWYCGNGLWKIRGFLDKIFGGVGLRRGRRSQSDLKAGDPLDFWRVLYANKEEGRLLLFAEMKLPGEAWLEFKIQDNQLIQTATFRPLGIAGRLYWYSVLIFHGYIFNGLIKKLSQG